MARCNGRRSSRSCQNDGTKTNQKLCPVASYNLQYSTSYLHGLLTMFSGVYELRMYDLVLGKREEWEQKIIQGLPDRCKLCEPVGVWFTEFGPQNRGTFYITFVLQHYIMKLSLNIFRCCILINY